MPNIEIWGMKQEDAQPFKANIWKALENEPFVNESVVTIVDSSVEDRHGKSLPFLRIVCDKRPDLDRTVELLTPLGFGIESAAPLCRPFVDPSSPKSSSG